MDARQFDSLARILAAGSSRRSVLTRMAGFGGGTLALLGATSARAQGNAEQGPACREEGHPCEGNQECCEGLVCEPSGPGAADRCTLPQAEECVDDCPEFELTTEIVAARAFRLEVDCAFDEETDQTTCECAAVGGDGDGTVSAIVVSAAATCAQVVGREVEFTAGPGFGIAGYTAEGGTLTLVLAGNVEANGTAVHWCQTEDGFVPATGPNLIEVGDDVSDAAGAIVVVGASCGAIQGNPDDLDWYARCTEPAVDLEFSLVGTGDGAASEAGTRRTNDSGRLRFARLEPGAYRLEPSGDGWCRAECDSLNDDGEVVIEAGQRAHVWVFACGG